MAYPQIIQGGMGISVSSWQLASIVAKRGQLGVVSGTGLDLTLAHRLQLGDLDGNLREAIESFPIKSVAQGALDRYFIPNGKEPKAPFKSKPVPAVKASQALIELTVLANYVEVFLAKRGHDGVIGINLLEKIQLPTLSALFGAMLAGVDYVLMGAGIPKAIPSILDHFAALEPAELKLDVTGAQTGEEFSINFDPKEFCPPGVTSLKRPEFLAIVSSSTLAITLARKCTGKVNGFVIEGKTAGGHNAPPRGPMTLDEAGEPIYGPRDEPELAQFRELGLPFWLAGSYGHPGGLESALKEGAQGIQVGTAFAFCNESGITAELKEQVIHQSIEHRAGVFTDPLASPTRFPFKVVQAEGSLSERDVYESRERICDLGYLRELYRKDDGSVGYRCPGEPVEDYVAKGGNEADTAGRKCVCNGLLSTIGLGQIRKGVAEPPLITAGDEVKDIAQFLKQGMTTYSADDVLDALLNVELSHIN